jgi:hypothetical protein
LDPTEGIGEFAPRISKLGRRTFWINEKSGHLENRDLIYVHDE